MVNTGNLLLLGAVAAICAAPVRAGSCETLAGLKSAGVEILSAQTVAGGSFTPPDGPGALQPLPDFCRVVLRLHPTADSDIGAEVWLPENWNSKLLAVGSGGWGGSIDYDGLAMGLRRGYVTSVSDDGHRSQGAAFVLGHPQKLVDFAYRAQHESTQAAKLLLKALYGRAARHAYWQGCSGGGREGLIQAYRYPEEFDGVIAGDPANIRRNAWALSLAVRALSDPADYIPAAKYPLIHNAVLAACDAQDGLKDGLIAAPENCRIDFSVLQCPGQDAADCLTARQVGTAAALISPATTRTGQILFPRLEPGTELRWGRLAGGPAPADLFVDEYRYVVYQDPNWDWHRFNLERDAAQAHAIDRNLDELNPHLAPFASRGGKLILYHGWADQQVAPGSSVEFYRSVRSASPDPRHADDWVRLFMAPGMAHCAGGEGPDTFDSLGALERWVEQGEAPDQLVAAHKTHGQVDRTRPLCPYPQVARYQGTGSIDVAANFRCAPAPR